MLFVAFCSHNDCICNLFENGWQPLFAFRPSVFFCIRNIPLIFHFLIDGEAVPREERFQLGVDAVAAVGLVDK